MRCSLVTLAAILCLSAGSAARAEVTADFQAAKREIQQQLRSRRPADRADAMRRLEQFPLVDAAKLIVPLAFKGQPDEVRKAGFTTLLTFKDNAEICEFLLETLRRLTSGKPSMRSWACCAAKRPICRSSASTWSGFHRFTAAYTKLRATFRPAPRSPTANWPPGWVCPEQRAPWVRPSGATRFRS